MSFRYPLANVPRAGLLILITTLPAARLVAAVPVDGEVRPIALSGRPAAGVPGATYSRIDATNAAVNDRGQAAFTAQLAGSGITTQNNQGLWLGDSLASQTLLARSGNQPPGLPSDVVYLDGFQPPSINNRGEVTFKDAFEQFPSQNVDYGAWTTAGGPARLLAAGGYPLPNTPGTPIAGGVWDTSINDAGQSSFSAGAAGSSHFVDTPGQPLRRAITGGDALPGDFGPHVYSLYDSKLANNGRLAFQAQVTSSSGNYYGLWSETSGSMQLVAREGGVPLGINGTINSIYGETLSSTGLLAFDELVISGSVLRSMVAQRPDGTLRLVAATYTPIPGSTSVFTNLYEPRINALGQVAFGADLSGYSSNPRPNSVWFEDSLGMHMLTRAGQAAPGAGGAVFDGFGFIQFNDNGDLMFYGTLTRGIAGVTDANEHGIWLRQHGGQLTLIARDGDYLDIAPGPTTDLRHVVGVNTLGYGGPLDQQRRMLTNLGEALFTAYFDDGSTGLFLTQPVPEPTSLAIALLLAIATASSCHRVRKKCT